MKRLTSQMVALIALFCASFLLLPVAALLINVSWTTLWQTWSQDGTQPLLISIESTLISMVAIALFGTPLAWLLARGKRRLWRIVEFLMLIPLLMPPLVVGLLLVFFYGRVAHWANC